MGKFVRNIQVVREFDGDKWKFTLLPLNHADSVTMFELTKKGAESMDKEKVFSVTMGMLPRYLIETSGGTDAAGQPLTKDDVLSSAYFIPLLAEVLQEWMERSMPGNSQPSGV
jgi:hypothetical protein